MLLEREVRQRLVLATPSHIAGIQHRDTRRHERLVHARHMSGADAEARKTHVEMGKIQRCERIQVVNLRHADAGAAQKPGQDRIPRVRFVRLPAKEHVVRHRHEAFIPGPGHRKRAPQCLFAHHH